MVDDNFVMQKESAGDTLRSHFGSRERMILNQAAFDGYRFADKWLRDDLNKFLGPYKKEVRGRAINWCVDDCVRQAVNSGALNLEIKEEFTSGKQYKYLVLCDKKRTIQLTVHQVANRDSIARKAVNRDDKIKGFQSYWNFSDSNEIETQLVTESPLYFQLTHGYQSQEPGFVTLGIPTIQNCWEDGSIDLSKEAQVISNQKGMNTTPTEFKSPSLEGFMDLLNEEES